MNSPYLTPGEQVVDVFNHAWLETPDRVDKVFTKLMVFSDRGTMVFTNKRIIFHGRRYFLSIEMITYVGRHKIWFKIGTGKGYVRIDALNRFGQIQTFFFAGGGAFVWNIARRSNELYQKIIAWKEKFS